MKILLTTLNAKFIHTSLALYYLKRFCASSEREIMIKEFTINGRLREILGEIYETKAEVVCFSCYIWNIEQTLNLCRMLKKVSPKTTIVLGGPEVSFDPGQIMAEKSFIDYIIFGEGEMSFRCFLEALEQGMMTMEKIAGLAWRSSAGIKINQERSLIENLDLIPFPYFPDELQQLKQKIVYYETSRGCPFDCQYCLSSTIHGVRYFSLERVKTDLHQLALSGVKQIKFVDRTFNCHRKRTKEILAYLLLKKYQGINFHFEISADLLDDEIISLLKEAPTGYFQLEIGIQSTNPPTLAAVHRKTDFFRAAQVVKNLRDRDNIHLHLDLIAGLPKEDITSFEKSFNDIFFLYPHQIQLGFLKLLKGSGLRKRAGELGIIFQDQPPYEILSSRELSFDELQILKRVENVLEKYYNSGRFQNTLAFTAARYPGGPFAFFLKFADFLAGQKIQGESGQEAQAKLLLKFFTGEKSFLNELLCRDLIIFDWLLSSGKKTVPSWLDNSQSGQELSNNFVKNSHLVETLLPHLSGTGYKHISKSVSLQQFAHTLQIKGGLVVSAEESPACMVFDFTQKRGVLGSPAFYSF